jgi:subtilisin family serine protease
MRVGKMISENYKIVLITFIILIFIVAIAPSNFAVAQEVSNPKLIKVFIGFVTTPGPAEKALVRAFGGNIRHTYRIIPAISAELPETVIPGLKLNPNVTTIEPVIKAYLINTNEDELNNTWGVKRIGSGVAHLNGYLGTGIKVAVIDSGVDYNHVDLAANFAGGYDFADADDDPMDFHSHGTHVAGTIAAIRNETGVVGAAPEVEIYALKVFSDYGSSANYDDIVAAIQWSVDNGIQVTNNSYGSLSNPGAFVQSAFDNAYDAGVLHVAAAGNETKGNQKNNVIYPAKFASVIAVSASDSNDIRAGFSSNGPEVELIAPGVSINSTVLNSTYGFKSGTSMASPHVAGVAALVWSANSSMSNAEIREALKNNAEDLGLTFNDQGYGLVRADLALALSSDASLFALEVSVGTLTPAFDPATTAYTVAVAHDTVSIDITAALADENASLTIDGVPAASGVPQTVTLNPAGTATVIDIVVTAEDGTTQNTYTITVNRAAEPGINPTRVGVHRTTPSTLTQTVI